MSRDSTRLSLRPSGTSPSTMRCASFDDGRLAHARLADQHRVVLGTTLQHLNGPADLVIATDHRIELAIGRALGEVQGVLAQRLALVLGIGIVDLGAAPHAIDGGFQRLARQPGLGQHLAHGVAHLEGRQ